MEGRRYEFDSRLAHKPWRNKKIGYGKKVTAESIKGIRQLVNRFKTTDSMKLFWLLTYASWFNNQKLKYKKICWFGFSFGFSFFMPTPGLEVDLVDWSGDCVNVS